MREKWIIIIALMVVFSAIIYGVSVQKGKVSKYIDESTQSSTEEKEIPGKKITNMDLGFSIKIPELWAKAEENGIQYYIDKDTSSYVCIKINNYNPNINNYNVDVAKKNDENNANYQLKTFTQISTSSYKEEYREIKSDNQIFDVLSFNTWNKDKIITIEIAINESYVLDMSEYYNQILKSFEWNKPNAIENDYKVVYIPQIRAELGFPAEWSYTVKNDVLTAYDNSTGTTFTSYSVDSTADFANLSKLNYTETLANNKNLFVLGTFNNSGKKLLADATYTNNGEKMYFKQIGIASGSKIYYMNIQMPYAKLNTTKQEQIEKIISYFRYFS